MNPKETLKNFKTKVDKELEILFDEKIKKYSSEEPVILEMLELLKEFTMRGGKRVRPALLYYTYKLFGGENNEEIIKTSIIVELIQTWALIQDDFMDHSDTRRNGITIHKKYEELAEKYNFKDKKHFGATMSIILSDIALQDATFILSKANFENNYKSNALKFMSEDLIGIIFGQTNDTVATNIENPSEEYLEKISYYKTGKYTFDLPCRIGAALAGAKTEDIEQLLKYTKPAGTAFQIRDDILGVFGEEKTTGKSNLSDLKEGKKTILILKTLEKANEEQKSFIVEKLGDTNLTEKDAEIIRNIIKETNSLDYSIQKCNNLIEQSQKELELLPKNNKDAWQFLYGIAEYMIVRDI